MITQQQKTSLIFAGLGLVILIVGLIGYALYEAYFKIGDSMPVRLVARVIHLPAARVGSHSISYDKFLMTKDAVVKFINSDAGQEVNAVMPSDYELNTNILERLIRQSMMNELAAKNDVTVSDEEVASVFEDVKQAAASSTTPDVGEYLWNNYGWHEDNFKTEVLFPALLEQKLATVMAQAGDEYALETALEARREDPDVIVYLKFE